MDGEYAPSPLKWVRDQADAYERSDGAKGAAINGMPIVLLTMRSAKTGKLRKIPLMRVEHDGRYAAVASMGGQPTHPTWYHTLRANPALQLQDGAACTAMLARELTGDERARWWTRAVAAYPAYADYQRKTTREIPVFVLEPDADVGQGTVPS